MEQVICFDSKKFKRFQNLNKICIIQFWSTWCGDCFEVSHLTNICKLSKKILIFRANFEDNEKLAEKYSIKVTPTYLFFKGSHNLGTMIGNQTEESIKEFLFGRISNLKLA